MANVSFQAPTDYSAEAEDLARRRRYAEMLQQQGMQPNKGSMAGRFYVAPSWTQGAASLAQSLLGAKEERDVTEKQKALGERMSGDAASRYAQALKLYQGTPGQTLSLPGNEMGDDPTQATIAPQKGDAGAAGALLQGNPMTAPLAQAMMAQMLKGNEPFSLREGEKRFGPNGQVLASNDKGPTFQAVSPGQTLVQVPRAGGPVQPAFAAPEKVDFNKPFLPNGQPNPAYQEYELKKAKAGKTDIATTLINAGPKAFETELGKLDAEKLGEFRKAAEAANNSLGVVQNLRAAVNQGVFEGGGAQAKTAVANMISGLTGAKITNLPGSQLFNAEASKLVLEHVKSLGANPSNADREFIEKTVPMLNTSPEARNALINFIEQKSAKTLDLYKRADTYARKNRGLGGFDMFGGQPGSPDVDALLEKYK